MRKLEQAMIAAINARKNWAGGNTSVRVIDDLNSAVFLHGNHIADYNSGNGFVMVNTDTLRRWPTPTTKSRLRALGANVYTKSGTVYLDERAV
jgi:hypothetical protein